MANDTHAEPPDLSKLRTRRVMSRSRRLFGAGSRTYWDQVGTDE